MALRDAPRVDVLKFDEKEAYNHDRPISSLIRTQLLHLHHAENIAIPPQDRTNTNINDLLTELAASEYIGKVTALLHKHGKKSKSRKKSGRRAGAALRKRTVSRSASGSHKLPKFATKKRASRK